MNIATDMAGATDSDARTATETTAPTSIVMPRLGHAAAAAARELGHASGNVRNTALRAMATALRDDTALIVNANAADVDAARSANKPDAFIDRLTLNAERVEAMAASLDAIADLDDPVGTTIAEWERPNGLQISRVRQPLGVIGIIYEKIGRAHV